MEIDNDPESENVLADFGHLMWITIASSQNLFPSLSTQMAGAV